MIGHLRGDVLFSDGYELVIQTTSGVGYQVYFGQVLSEGIQCSIYISHIIRESSEDLYGFKTLREKKMFELILSVKGVGPKSGFALLNTLTVDQIIEAVTFEQKKTLQKTPGIGAKAAAQMILDLCGKVQKIKMYSNKFFVNKNLNNSETLDSFDLSISDSFTQEEVINTSENVIISDALMACKELGFNEGHIVPIANKVMSEHRITKAEQLVHLVLKEI